MENRLELLAADRGGRGITAREFLNPASRVDELLFSGEERVACGADTNLEFAARGAGVVDGSAGARDGRLGIVGMNICFHGLKRELDTNALPSACNQKECPNRLSDSPSNLPSSHVFLAAWKNTLRRLESRPAILAASGEVLRTFGQIQQEAADLQPIWAEAPPGAVVGVKIGNHPGWPAVLLGLFGAGLVPLPLGDHLSEKELAELDTVPRLPELRLCVSAGVLLPQWVAEQFAAKFRLKIHAFYGASECGGIAYDGSAISREEGFVGTALDGVTIGWGTKGSEPGRLTVEGPAVGDGYFPIGPGLDQGRFVPEDLIARTQDGLKIVGRVSDLINIAGRKLNPAVVEEKLRQCPMVKEAVVFGVPSALRGEEAVACVVAHPNGDPVRIQRFCARELSPWQVPKTVWLVPEIPTNERGKLSRSSLAQIYLGRS